MAGDVMIQKSRKFSREDVRQGYFERYPKDRYQTEVRAGAVCGRQSANIKFTMKRLREPVAICRAA
jgi:hypothetical protein